MNARFLNTALGVGVFLSMSGVLPVSATRVSVAPSLRVTTSAALIGRLPITSLVLAEHEQESPAPYKTQGVKGKPVTRAQVAQKIYLAFQKTLDKAALPLQHGSPYQDITTNDPNFHAILVLDTLHIVSPSADEKFQPQENVSRYELCMAMDRLVSVLKVGGLDALMSAKREMPQDMPTTVEAYPSVEKMLKLGEPLTAGLPTCADTSLPRAARAFR